jgi:hypothetical protein
MEMERREERMEGRISVWKVRKGVGEVPRWSLVLTPCKTAGTFPLSVLFKSLEAIHDDRARLICEDI